MAKLFIYSYDKQFVIGAFTHFNNKDFKRFATSVVKGDEIVIELFEPINVEFNSHAIIGQVNHDYKNIFKALGYGLSGTCEVNVNCAAGEPWQDDKKSVGLYTINGSYYNSGALINNTNFSGIPYFLTAAHCFYDYTEWESKDSAANVSLFYFNFESPSCEDEEVTSQTISGAYLKAYWNTSDFLLVQLTEQPTNAYYSGWDHRNINASTEAGIHHPQGDIKKISISSNPVMSTALQSNTYNSDAHYWRIVWTLGVTEQGSSGSPLYNQNHKIVGQLAGGYSDCTEYEENGDDYGPDEPDWYGKFSSSWTGGGTDNTRLSNWLNPCDADVDTLEGTYWHSVSGNPYMSGPNLLCSSDNYIVHNLPVGAEINWSCTSNIHKVSTENPDTCEFEKYSNGNGYIYVLIDKVCPGDVNLSKAVHTGPYSSSDYPISGPSSAQCESWVSYSIPQLSGVTSINWDWPQEWTYYSGQGTRYLALITGLYDGIVLVGVNNTCGQSGSYASKYTYVYGYCDFGFSYYPNPASDEVTITINEQETITADDSDISEVDVSKVLPADQITYTIRIYNNLGTLVYSAKKTGTIFNIPLLNLRDGTYIIEVSYDKYSHREQLIIKHD
jgi:V8-like Glu-specific endopeptidase